MTIPYYESPEAKIIIWSRFKHYLAHYPPEYPNEQIIKVRFSGRDGYGEVYCINLIGYPSDECPLSRVHSFKYQEYNIVPNETLDELSVMPFVDGFKLTFVNPLIENIPFDWWNDSGGYGVIQYRYNPDPDIMFDIAYEGFQRNLVWHKTFDQ